MDDYSGIASPAQGPAANTSDPYAGFASPAAAQQQSDPYASVAAPQPHQSFLDRLGHDIHGAFIGADMNGFGGLVARKAFEWSGYGIDKLKAAYPGQSDDWYKQQQKQIINQSVQQVRQNAAQEQQQNALNIPGTHIDPTATVAGVVGSADPTLAIGVPGLGGALAKVGTGTVAKYATRVGLSAAAHGAYGSAADAAYQGADMLDGLQKNFDVDRNLHAAAGMAALGGAGTAVAPFVKRLFMERNGVDTTPSENPQATTNPMSGGLTPQQLQDFHQVLSTGNESDIHNFFDGKNVVPPPHADIHDWVSRRDNGTALQSDVDPEQLTQNIVGTPDQREFVNNHIQEQTKDWKNAPDYEVINHTDEIQDPNVRAAAVADNADHPDALGFVGGDNKVRIFANKIDSPETLNAVLYHESLGHYGLQQQFGDRLDTTINTLLKRNVGQFGKDVDQWQKDNPGAYNGDRTRAAEEVLANMSNDGTLKPSLADAITAHVRNFGRKMGLKLSYSDAEVRNILAMSHDAVINGNGRNVRANGFSMGPNKFMFVGEGSNTYDRIAQAEADKRLQAGEDPNAVRAATGVHYASDGDPRMEISDDSAQLLHNDVTDQPILHEPGIHKLGDVLHHPRLFDAYPALRDTEVHSGPIEGGLLGGYDPATRSIHIDPSHPNTLSTTLHETQHAIQDMEYRPGMTADGNEHLSDAEYSNDPLEREAYSTEARKDMSAYERRMSEMPRFMRRGDLAPKDVADEAYDRLNATYKPTKSTWEETAALAKDTALSPEMIRESRSVGNLDRKLFVYDQAAREANDKMMAFAEKAKSGPLSAEDHAAAIETAANFNYVLGRIENDSRQIARGLNAMKAVRFSRNNLLLLQKALADGDTNLDALTDPDTMNRFLRQYNNLAAGGKNPNGAANMLKSVTQPYWWQYLLSFRQNMMLSGLSTHLKSTMDMATMIGRELQETTLALPGAAVRESLRSMGVNVKPGVHPTELAARLTGLARAAVEAKTYVDTLQALKKGTPASQTQWANGSVANPRIPIVSKVSDLVSAQDTFFRSFLTNQNLYAIGTRDAYNDLKAASSWTRGSQKGKVSWDDAMTDGAARARNPTQSMLDEAKELTENTILLNKSPLNSAIDKIRAIKPGMNAYEQLGSFTANLLTPFIRVGSNALMNQVIRRSPLAFLDPVTRADFAAGGARADIAVARIALGTALIGMYWNAADPKKDQITGEGGDNRNKVLEREAGGWTPNAIHENGRYNQTSNLNISFNPFDKHNNVATMVAGLREAYEKGADAGKVLTGIKLAMISSMHMFANQTFVNDLSPAVDTLTDRHDTAGQKVGQFAADTAKSFLPNATNQLARIADPNKHDTRSDTIAGTVGNTLESSVPGLTGNLPVKYNVYGQPMKTGTSPTGVHTWVSNGNGQNETTDPTEKELSRLASLTKAAIITPTQRSIKVEGVNVKLTPKQAEDYQKYAGQTIVQAVREQMQSGSWNSISDQDRVMYVHNLQTQAKKEVRETLLQQPGWLNQDQLTDLRSQLNGK